MRACAPWLLLVALSPGLARAEGLGACASEPSGERHALALHRYLQGLQARNADADRDEDRADVAILQDRGDLVARRNPFDLDASGLRFVPNGAGGYDPGPLALPPGAPGEDLRLGDDEARRVELPFAFPFYGTNYTHTYVHSDGSLSFGAPDLARSDRGMARFLSGPPRIAPFFTDLDPGRGGRVTAQLVPDRARFLWSEVPGALQSNRNTFEATLYSTGRIDFAYGPMGSREAVVGLSPGATLEVTAADLSAGGPLGASGALCERFSETEKADLVSVVRRFLTSHADLAEQLVVYTARPLNPLPGSLAFEVNVRNEVKGIGLPTQDAAADWGSSGALASVVYMDSIDAYLDLDGFEVLAHEVGHRWLAALEFRDPRGERSRALLAADRIHWSFFLDSGASVLGGNRIADLGGGRFETVDFARGYGPLDRYAMGLLAPEQVPPVFYVEAPDDFRPNRTYKPSSSPEAGVAFTGVRREVRVEDVVAALGPREPPAAAPRVLRQAYLLVADAEAPATAARAAAVARIRARFEAYFAAATGGLGRVDSRLP